PAPAPLGQQPADTVQGIQPCVATDGIVVQEKDLPHLLAGKSLGQQENGLYPIGKATLAALSVLPLEFGYFIIGQFHTVKFAKDRRKANIFRSNAHGSDQMHSPISGFKVEAV